MTAKRTVIEQAGPTLEDRWPCIPDTRHTFAAHAATCLCGALRVSSGVSDPMPYVTLITPARP